MKNKLISKLLWMVLFGSSLSVSAQIYVKIRPIAPVIVVTSRPSNHHVWIGDEWEPYDNGYRYAGGRWEDPPRGGARWKQGHWRHHEPEGHEWVRGRWRGGRK